MGMMFLLLCESVGYTWPVFSKFRFCLLPPQTSVLNCHICLTPWRDLLTFGIKS